MMTAGKTLLGLIAAAWPLMAAPLAAQEAKVAIANLGPDPALVLVLDGFKTGMTESGYVEGKTVEYDYQDASFDPSVVAQMIATLEAGAPDLFLTVTTPITQASRRMVRDKSIPIVFAPVTDPIDAGLVPSWEGGSDRFTGASNLQSMQTVLDFARTLLGDADNVGILYNPGDANDVANLGYAEAAAKEMGVTIKAVSVESTSDIPVRVNALKGVDFLYLIPSSMLQPAIPAVSAAARQNDIPIISASANGLEDGLIYATMSVSWFEVGRQAGLRAARILKGEDIAGIEIYRPSPADHAPAISAKYIEAHDIQLPDALADCDCVK